ncbi:MAG: hypothetical protein IKR59_03805 [Lachnospiraceae bacterium]|nr:hypothetical protein [Lachnospiraceae bacterium]
MKKLIIVIIVILAALLLTAGIIVLILCLKKKNNQTVKLGTFLEMDYTPGYGDMNGASHREYLDQDKEGKWTIVSNDREDFESPWTVTTYAVSDEALKEFEAFVKEKNVPALADRKDSEEFITDYTAWNFVFYFDNTSVGGEKQVRYSIEEYKVYSDSDTALLKELRERFKALHGEILSQETKTED